MMRPAIFVAPVLLMITSCAPTAARLEPAKPTQSPPPTQALAATWTPRPPTDTPVPSPIPTETPVGLLFRDDFSGALAPGWSWQNEDPTRWTITRDGWLQIVGTDAGLLGGGDQSNLLWRDMPDGDFQITTHLMAKPTDDFQQATIYLYENGDNYIAINRGYCSPCTTKGNGIFMEYKISGNWGAYQVATTATDLYLRLLSQGNVLSGYYALTPGEWTRVGRFGNYFGFRRVGVGVTNLDSKGINADLVGLFDYFEISRPGG